MDDDRPSQPDDHGTRTSLAARARDADLDAFLHLVRPHAGRLLRLATLVSGDPGAAADAAAAAVRSAWRDARRLDPDDLGRGLEDRLLTTLERRRRPAPVAAAPLERGLFVLAARDRLALARCLDPLPDREALAVAGRLGVETATTGVADAADGDIVDLGGPLAGWDLGRLRAALVAAAGPVEPEALLDRLRLDLADVRPQSGSAAALRAALPGPTGIARGVALVLVAGFAAGALAWTASRGDPAIPGTAGPPAAGAPGDGPGVAGARVVPTPTLDAATATVEAGFPAAVDGLAVVDVAEARRLADDPALAGRAIAVRGWMSTPTLRGVCSIPSATAARGGRVTPPDATPDAITDPLSRAAAFCPRDTTLRSLPGGPWRTAHLHPQLLPGTSLGRVASAFAAADGAPVPVVLVGHFGDAGAATCAPGGRHCGEELVVDRIAWATGAPIGTARAIHPASSGALAERSTAEIVALVEQAFGGLRVLSIAGLPAPDIGLVEPAAAAVAPLGGFAWLVRAIAEPRRGDAIGGSRTWLVVDDATGAVIPAPGSVARAGASPGAAFLFPATLDRTPVRSVGDARALAEAGLPTGATMAVAGWLATPVLAGACLAEAGLVKGPLDREAAFCRRATTIRGPATDGHGLALQLPPGTPGLPIDAAVADRGMPVPVIALVQAGSPRSEPCWPTDDGCGRTLVLERLLWIDGRQTDVAVAELVGPPGAAPRLSPAEVRSIAEAAVGREERVVSIVCVPAARRDEVAPGSAVSPVAGDHAWIVRVRSPMIRSGGTTDLDFLWWLIVDDATGRPSTLYRTAAAPAPAGHHPA